MIALVYKTIIWRSAVANWLRVFDLQPEGREFDPAPGGDNAAALSKLLKFSSATSLIWPEGYETDVIIIHAYMHIRS